MADTRVCPECAKKKKAGIMELTHEKVLGGDYQSVYVCTRCGHRIYK